MLLADDAPPLSPEEAARIKRRARFGMAALALRTALVQGLTFASGLVLARTLDPSDFGAYASTLFLLELFAILGDAGIGASLIRQKQEPSRTELATVFWSQIGIAAVVIAVAWAGSLVVHAVYPSFPKGGEWLLRVLSFTFLTTMLRTLPSVLMERELAFGKLAAVEVITSIAYHASIIALALMGLGVWSFIVGGLIYGVVGTTAAYLAHPYRPSLAFDRAALRPLLRFGLTMQVKTALAFLNGAVTPLYVGRALGMSSLGLVTWAQTTASFPLKLVEIMGRVSFPIYARLREDRRELASVIERNLQLGALATLFFVGLVLGIGPELTAVVFSPKWLPALSALYVFAAAIGVGFVTPLVAAALDAIGRPDVVARLSLGWTLLNWIVVVATTTLWPVEQRVLGFAIAYAVHLVVGNVAVLVVLARLVPGVRVWSSFRTAIAGSACVALVGRVVLLPRIGGWPSLVLAIGASGLVFLGVSALVDRSVARRLLELRPGATNG